VLTLRRRAARVVLLDAEGRVLLLKARDPADPVVSAWWELPGGGIEAGESSEDAGRREVFEETGITDLEMGPAVWTQRAVFDFGGYHFDQQERIHIAHCAGGEVRPGGLEALEVESFIGWSWNPVDALGAIVARGERVIPDWLPEQLPAVLASGLPDEPVDMGLLSGR
jgi:8-oxo-dGTP pyrophosphatase MutT (NUDIX family)